MDAVDPGSGEPEARAAIALVPEVCMSSHCKEEAWAQRSGVMCFPNLALALVVFCCNLVVPHSVFHPCNDKAGRGGTHLQSQHSEARVGRITVSSRSQPVGYISRHPLHLEHKPKEKQNKTWSVQR